MFAAHLSYISDRKSRNSEQPSIGFINKAVPGSNDFWDCFLIGMQDSIERGRDIYSKTRLIAQMPIRWTG